MRHFDYPFNYDGVSYFQSLAHAYNQGSLGAGLSETMNSAQLPLYYSIQLVVSKLFGFSYPVALAVQTILTLLLCVAIAHSLYKSIFVNSRPSKALIAGFVSISIGIICASGFLHVFMGNIFDFRIDLIGALLLTMALVSFERQNWFSSLWVALAVCERFHNLSIILVTLPIWAFLSAYLESPSRGKHRPLVPGLLKTSFQKMLFPCIGLVLIFVLRHSQFLELARYYWEGHFGLERQLRGSNWGIPGFFSYYPKGFIRGYLNIPLILLVLGANCFGLYLTRKDLDKISLKRRMGSVLPLIVGGTITFILLTIDPARNNNSVIRYFSIPFAFSLIGISTIVLKRILSIPRIKKAGMAFVFVYALACLRTELIYLERFYENFDYMGIRKFDIVSQIDPIFQKMYLDASPDPTAAIKVAANFDSDLNFHPGQWNIFLASHQLRPKGYVFLMGSGFYIENFQRDKLPLLKKINYWVQASSGCILDWIPTNQEIKKHTKEIQQEVRPRCNSLVGKVQLENCEIEVSRCQD